MKEITNQNLALFLGERTLNISTKMLSIFGPSKACYITKLYDWYRYLYQKKLLEKDGWFYIEQERIANDTGIPPKTQTAHIDYFTKIGVLDAERRGIPYRNYYRINTIKLAGILYCQEKPQNTSTIDAETTSILTPKGSQYIINSNNKTQNTCSSIEELRSSLESQDIGAEQPSVPLKDTSSVQMEGEQTIPRKRFNRPPKLTTEQLNTAIVDTFNNAHPEKTKKPEEALKVIPGETQELLEHWTGHGFRLPDPQRAPKTYNKTIRAIRKLRDGCFIPGENRKFSYGEIKDTIDKFALLVFNPGYGPSQVIKDQLSQKSLLDFIYCSHARGTRSWFLKCHDEPIQEKNDAKLVPNKHPEVANRIKKYYCQYVLAGFNKRFSENEENKFREAANRVAELLQKKGHRFVGITGGNFEIADLLCQSISSFYGDRVDKVTPGSFCSSFAFSRLIAYMNTHGYIVDAESQQFH